MAKQVKKTLQERTLALLNERFSKRVADVFFEQSYTQIISQGTTSAINDFGYEKYEVKVTPWFDNYWFFIRIQFNVVKPMVLKPFTSVSFFQDTGEKIKQLFRAEWDCYDVKDGYNHPQPHWHFTAQLSDITKLSDLENIEEENIYNQMLGNSKSINLDKMHFAMIGTWQMNGNIINSSMNDESVLVDWLVSLFSHVREELVYKDE